MATSTSEEFEFAGKLSELKSCKRLRVTVKDRVLAIFYANDQVYALDHFCYHTGGPLSVGDIEDSYGRTCVVCPWHKHKITLDTGESLYSSIDPNNPRNVKHNCSKGVKQRTHHVKIEGDDILVQLSDLSGKVLDSDRYFTEEYKTFMENVMQDPVLVDSRRRMEPLKVPLHSTRTNLKKF